MANRKITEFVSLTQPAGDDVFPIVDVSEALDVDKNKKITVAEIFKSIPSGSAAAPGIAFEGNDSVGIYRPGTDQLAISTGGTGRLFVDASGNVGIGTGSPAAALHLAGTATQRFTNTTNTSGFDIGLLGGSADVNAYIYNRGNGALVVGTNNVERLRVTNTGQVYIPHTVTSLATTIAINNTDATSGTGNRIAFQSNGTNVGTFDWDYTGGVFNTTIGSYGNLIFKTNGASPTERLRITSTGQIQSAGLGSAASPTLSFTTDTNTGIYSPGADQLAISTNGAGRLFVDASGNVGVGTASEPRRLHVSNGYSAATSIDGSIALLVTNNAGANDFAGVGIIGGGTSGGSFIHFGDTANAGIGRIGYFHSDDSFRFNTNGSERLRITSTGTVNIVGAGTAGSTQAISFNGSAPVNSLVVDSSGRCGIGTSSPGAVFHAQSASGPVGIFYYAGGSLASPTTNTVLNLRDISYGATTTTKFNFTDANGYEQAYIGAEHNASFNGSGSLVFGTASLNAGATERLRITAAGLVGIGTTSPAKQLHVEATSSDVTLRIGRNGYVQTDLIGSTGAGANDFKITQNGFDRFVIEYGGNSAARIDSSGRLLVGTSTGRSVYGSNAQVQLEGTTYPTTAFNLIANSNANSGTAPYVQFARSRGTANGSNTIVQAGDRLGGIAWCGANGSNLDTPAAAIEGLVDTGTPSATSMPGRIVLSTTADGAGSVTERMRITSAGNVGINSTLSGNANNQVLIRKNSNSAIVDALLLNNGNADNNAGTGVRINFSGVSEANSHLRYAYIESATTSSGNDHYLAFGTNSAAAAPVERLRITSAGNVGIGTSSASAPLAFGKAVYAAPSSEDFYRVKFEDVGGIANDVGLGQAGSGTLGLNCAATGNVIFYKGGTETVRVDSSGRVGIGTSSPGAPLDVNGAIYSRSTGVYTDTITSYTGSSISVNAGSSNINFIVNASERARIDSSGRLGLGTSSPSSYDFNGPVVLAAANTAGSSTISVISDAASLGQLAFADGTTGTTRYRGLLEYNHSTDAFQIRTAGAPAVTIDSSQRVGIGTTNPTQKLQITDGTLSNFYVAPGYNSGTGTLLATGGSEYLAFATNGLANERARIDSSGRLLVGTSTGQGSSLLQVQGTSSSSTVGADVFLRRGALPSVLGAGLGFIYFGDNSGNLGAVIGASADGSWTSGSNHRSFLSFSTTANNGTDPTERLRIDSSGRVGIGTSSPGSLLDVGSGTAVGITQATVKGGTSAGDYGIISIQNGSTVKGRFVADAGNNDFRIDTGGNATGKIQFWTGSSYTHAVTIDSSQRVGIGVTSPGYLFEASRNTSGDVAAFTASTDRLRPLVFSSSDNTASGAVWTRKIDSAFGVHAWSINSSERARIDSSGRLLVGTSTAPVDGKLYVQGNSFSATEGGVLHLMRGEAATAITVGEEIGKIAFSDNAGKDFATITTLADAAAGTNDYPGRLVFSTTADGASSPTERGRITNAGYWKLTSNNTYVSSAGAFHEIVHGATGSSVVVSAENASFAAGVMQLRANRATTDSTFNALEYYNAGSAAYRFFVRDSGNVQNTNNSYGAISDIKLKENIVDANSQWGDIKALQVRNYNFKEGQTHTQIGLIAQEVELVSPGLVNESPDRDEDGNDLGTVTKSINYSVLYMKAVKALQEAMERIEALEAKVAALEGN